MRAVGGAMPPGVADGRRLSRPLGMGTTFQRTPAFGEPESGRVTRWGGRRRSCGGGGGATAVASTTTATTTGGVASPRKSSAPAAGALSDEELRRMAERTGYRQIGAQLPEDVTLAQIARSMPAEVFELDHGKAWRAVGITLGSLAASLWLVSVSPWYLLPVSWLLAGTAATGLFVIGHDCGHRSFHRNPNVEDVVGTLLMAPLIYPFEPWRIKHNQHHAHTNKLGEDTAWHPLRKEDWESWGPAMRGFFYCFYGTPARCLVSIAHWLVWHFSLELYTEKQRPRVIVSWLAVAAFALVGLPAIVAGLGWFGLVKFWLVPWLLFHFWMSTFTVVHHTAPHIPFKSSEDWNAAEAQLSGSVHCDYPAWVDFLTHDISWHVPHHISAKIPWYNLRDATQSLRANWGRYMTECTFNWKIMGAMFTQLHFYDEENNYAPLDWEVEEPGLPYLAMQRKLFL